MVPGPKIDLPIPIRHVQYSKRAKQRSTRSEGRRYRKVGFSGVLHRHFALFGMWTLGTGPCLQDHYRIGGKTKADVRALVVRKIHSHSFTTAPSGPLIKRAYNYMYKAKSKIGCKCSRAILMGQGWVAGQTAHLRPHAQFRKHRKSKRNADLIMSGLVKFQRMDIPGMSSI